MKSLALFVITAAAAWAQSDIAGGSSQQNAVWPVVSAVAPSLATISVTPVTPSQVVGSVIGFTAMGTFSDGSTLDVTQSSIWSTGTPSVAIFGSLGTQQMMTCLTPGTSFVTATKGSITGSTTLTCVSRPASTAGCGAGTGGAASFDQSTCGNYAGAPYEDLNTASSTTPPSPFGSGAVHLLTVCTNVTSPASGDVWRLGNDINDGIGGTNQNCLQFPGGHTNYVIDLGGHTLTGGISFPSNGISGVTIVNGTINCNIATSGTNVACIYANAGNTPTQSFLLSHLTVNNSNYPGHPDGTAVGNQYDIFLAANGTTTATCPVGADQKLFNGACLEIAHVTTTPAAGYSGVGYTNQWCGRCTNIWINASGGNSAEVWNTQTFCGGYIDACQGIVLFDLGAKTANHNFCNWSIYQGVGDNGRCILFDSAGGTFNVGGGSAFNNEILVYNNRSLRARTESNITFHDNRMEHIQGASNIFMGNNDDYSENQVNTISNNTFLFEGGTGMEITNAYGIVADSNTFTCISNCSTSTVATTNVESMVWNIVSASRTAGCVVTLTLSSAPSTTSKLAGVVYVNVSGTGADFDVSGTAGNLLTTRSGTSFTYTQAGCTGANSYTYSSGPQPTFWMAQNATDNFAANGAQFYIKNSTIDPLLTSSSLIRACGQTGSVNACLSGTNPQQSLNGGQTQIQWCNNLQGATLVPAVGGTGALVTHQTPDSACP